MVRNIYILSAALETIESMLCQPLSVDALAQSVYCSPSALQKLFRYAFGYSVADYIAKRRLSKAAHALLCTERSVTDVALDYQYASPEVFTRAFRRFWGVTPSAFRKTRRFAELFPKFENPIQTGGSFMSNRKPMDISQLYDELKKLSGTYVLCADIRHFKSINDEYGFAIGDIVIAEAFGRIERALSDDMLLFRTGGDEFAIVTGYEKPEDAQALAARITAHNGQPVRANEHDVPLALLVGITRIPEGALSYRQALDMMEAAVSDARAAQKESNA